ncbi:MAG: nucleotidyl transferase AbiEii/AbiGii toxin family protein [Acidobacteriota bacterium]
MHPKVLSGTAWTLIRRIVGHGLLDGWVLAGGTGLALQLGHRHSEDLDLFRTETFDPQLLLQDLARLGKVVVQAAGPGTLHAAVDGLRVSFLQAQAGFLYPGTTYRGMVIADPADIAVMKLVAIGGRGGRKDFVDLYFLLRNGVSLDGSLKMLKRRFRDIDHNEYHLRKSLVYFTDAESEPMPNMIRAVPWETMKETIVEEVRRLS